MTCVSILYFWYLATLSPPQLIARFPTQEQCERVAVEMKSSYTITGHAWTR